MTAFSAPTNAAPESRFLRLARHLAALSLMMLCAQANADDGMDAAIK